MLFCVWPTVWPDPEPSARETGAQRTTCWAEFDTADDRDAHYATAHPEYFAAMYGPDALALFVADLA